MKRRLVCIAAIAALMSLSWAAFAAMTPLLTDNFDQDAAGAFPGGWSRSMTAGAVGISTNVAAGTPSGNNWVDFHDDNSASSTNTANATLYRTFPIVTSGQCIVQFDVNLAQTGAAFGTRVYDGVSPTNGVDYAAGMVFEGNHAYSTGGGAGKISIQTTGGGTYVLTSPLVTYSANQWYTVEIVLNLDTKMYQVFFGPQGGTLAEITTPGGIAFMGHGTGNTQQVSKVAGITFFSSIQKTDAPGDLFIDNVSVQGDLAPAAVSTVSAAKTTPIGTYMEIDNKVVTAGTDQVGNGVCYIQDDTGGIRVRTNSTQVIHQGDQITVFGAPARTADDGTPVIHNGEKEISAISITDTPGPFTVPNPTGMTNAQIGGGPFGITEADGEVSQPGVYYALDPSAPQGYDRAPGLSNIGRYGRFWGRVLYANDASHFFYIDDGSGVIDGSTFSSDGTNPQVGVRVLVPATTSLASVTGQYALVNGIVGCNSTGQLVSGSGITNVRLIRAVGPITFVP